MDKIIKGGFFLFFCTGLAIGGIFGILVLNSFISYRIDQYHQKINTLESQIEDKDLRLEKLEDTINKKKLIVKSIEITLEDEKDEFTKLALEKNIKEKLGKFIGKEVNKVDIDMLWDIADERIVKLKDKEYSLNVNKLLIYETIHIWVEVQRQE
jgi:hypothetical protein